MSLQLTDLLIEISEPTQLQSFYRDPEGLMSAFGLNDEDKAALRSRKAGLIRMSTPSSQVGDEAESTAQFLRHRNSALIEIEPMAEIMSHDVDQVADPTSENNLLFIDESGRVFRAVIDSAQ